MGEYLELQQYLLQKISNCFGVPKELLGKDDNPQVMELVDVLDSKSSAFGRVGSTPTLGTKYWLFKRFLAHFR